jgi:REP element-mobilizing transposase RayT
MAKKAQQSLFDQVPKRGRPPKKPSDHFGGRYLLNYNPKFKRPMDSKKALHLILRSSKSTGARSLKNEKYEAKIWQIVSHHAQKLGISIYSYSNGGNHLHLLIRAKYRDDYNSFIRTITGLIARAVGKTERGHRSKEKFWDARPFSRIVSFAKREFQMVRAYLLRNTLEAIGWLPYISRDQKLPAEWRAWLMAANGSS